jgi:hypothetical protein
MPESFLINPYIAGNPISDSKGFFGRDDIFREVMQVLRHPMSNAIVLFGQRRIGKTSVLLQLQQRLADEHKFIPVYFDLHDKAAKPLAQVLYELAQYIAVATEQPLPERAQFDAAGDYFRQTFLPAAAKSAAYGGLVLLLDEFDVLDTPGENQAGQTFFPYLRALMADIKRVQFVFAIGRRPEELSTETVATFKDIRATRISRLERKEAEAIVRQSERDNSLVWADEAIEKVWDWAQGHPFFAQLLSSVVWENAYDDAPESPPCVEPGSVDAAITEALQQGANAFHWLWDGLPPAERVVLAAMAESADVVITQEKIVEILNRSGVRLIVRQLELAPETLVDWELLQPTDGGYRFVLPLLRRWVSANRPLRRVKEELDRLDPVAEMLFQTGQHFYSQGESNEAESQLRKALNMNPNHLKSRLLLAEILLESDRISESVAILEEAYKYDEVASQADLIRARLAEAESQSEDKQLTTYERVLSINPNQPVAKERREKIWIDRGETALKEEQWEKAEAAFRKAGELARIEQVHEFKRKREVEKQLQSAKENEAKGNWGAAITIYEALMKEYPDEAEWKTRLENAHIQKCKLAIEKQLWLEAQHAISHGKLLSK